MSYGVSGTTISLTRGDTCNIQVSITDAQDCPYVPTEGDSIRFAMKARYEDPKPLLVIDVPTDTMVLAIRPEDTKDLTFGTYVYDIQLTKATGEVDTFITKSKIKILEEVC